MAFKQNSEKQELERAAGWLNVYVSDNQGQMHKVGAIPLNNSKALHARINAACAKQGLEVLEDHLHLVWQAGGNNDPAALDLPF
jgi:hypothetical protein